MSDASRHLRSVPLPVQRASVREFAVRFSATSGLVARLYKPLNSFHWVGPATLRFSSQGVLIVAKRATWFGLRQTDRLITAEEIRDVYREANAVQVNLHGHRNAYSRLWSEDSAAAARIVELLPTKHTIEFENAIREPEMVIAWRVPAVGLVLSLVLASVAVLAWMTGHRSPAVVATAQVARALPQPRSSNPTAKPEVRIPNDDILLTERDLRVDGARIEALSNEFRMAYEALQDGRVTQEKFADELDQWLRPQWDDLEARLRRADPAQGSAQERADRELMGVINNWQLALYSYADDLRNQRQAVKSLEYLTRADQYLQRAQEMQSKLATRPRSEAPPAAKPH